MPSSSRARAAAAACGRAAVDHDQVRRVGELLRRGDVRLGSVASGIAQRVELAGLLPLGQVAAEPADDHLVDGGDVVSAVQALDGEPAVLALAGQPVLEDDHGRDDVRALEVGDVVALDPQGGVVQADGSWISCRARLLVVRSQALRVLCRARASRGVAGYGLQECLLVAALGYPQVDGAAPARPATG